MITLSTHPHTRSCNELIRFSYVHYYQGPWFLEFLFSLSHEENQENFNPPSTVPSKNNSLRFCDPEDLRWRREMINRWLPQSVTCSLSRFVLFYLVIFLGALLLEIDHFPSVSTLNRPGWAVTTKTGVPSFKRHWLCEVKLGQIFKSAHSIRHDIDKEI